MDGALDRSGSMSASRSAPDLLPPATPSGRRSPAGPRAVYEVTSGLVALRPEPDTECPSVGSLRGGVRFLGTPEKLGAQTWLKVQLDDVCPPLFSPSGLGPPQEQNRGLANDMSGRPVYRPAPGVFYKHEALAKSLDLYRQSASQLSYTVSSSTSSPGGPAELWVRNQDKCIVRVCAKPSFGETFFSASTSASPTSAAARDLLASPQRSRSHGQLAPLKRKPSSLPSSPGSGSAGSGAGVGLEAGAAAEAASPGGGANDVYLDRRIAELEGKLEAMNRDISELSAAPDDRARRAQRKERRKQQKHYARLGPGAWVNFGGFGSHGGPVADNCGRWRQLSETSIKSVMG
eukprot:TRINITY_DN5351_c0_g1_i1.p1 TRINITY_DN5351_c0_g1~~TRINITY_DN5351_c0_g1_i1.p1  ORF type:complete len:347 (-),score=60.33 TRINITY_DN5351_c0_g1_i1:147-1187(-)